MSAGNRSAKRPRIKGWVVVLDSLALGKGINHEDVTALQGRTAKMDRGLNLPMRKDHPTQTIFDLPTNSQTNLNP
jgi:hypothetical protein